MEALFAHFANVALALRAVFRAFRFGHAPACLGKYLVSDQACERFWSFTFASKRAITGTMAQTTTPT